MAPSARLLDLDGTLVLTQPTYARCLAADGGITNVDALRALRSGESVVAVARRVGLGKAAFARRVVAAGIEVVEGWDETLDVLQDRGHQLGIVTSLPGWLAIPILASTGLSTRFDVVVHAGVCRVPKPSPRPILTAFAVLSREPTPEDLYVGDTSGDLGAATRAGIRFAWAVWGYGQPVGEAPTLVRPQDLLNL